MGQASAAKTRKKIVVDAVRESVHATEKVLESLGTCSIEVFTGHQIRLVNDVVKVVKVESVNELKKRPWAIVVKGEKVDRGENISETFLSISCSIPIHLDEIIDKDTRQFNYTYDTFLSESQACISRLTLSDEKNIDKNLSEIIKEAQRIIILYSDAVKSTIKQ